MKIQIKIADNREIYLIIWLKKNWSKNKEVLRKKKIVKKAFFGLLIDSNPVCKLCFLGTKFFF